MCSDLRGNTEMSVASVQIAGCTGIFTAAAAQEILKGLRIFILSVKRHSSCAQGTLSFIQNETAGVPPRAWPDSRIPAV